MNKELEESINILNQKLKEWQPYKKDKYTMSIEQQVAKENDSIETVLNELKRLQEENEKLKVKTWQYDKTLEALQKDTIWKTKLSEKLEEILKKHKYILASAESAINLYADIRKIVEEELGNEQ